MEQIKYSRKNFAGKYHIIEILDCPIEIIKFAAKQASPNVTVENRRSHSQQGNVRMILEVGDIRIEPTLLRYQADFLITRDEFLSLTLKYWDKHGCYAVFHEAPILKFKATDLEEIARYRVFDNFGWTLELAIPDGTSSGWGQIASPSLKLIDSVEERIKNYG